MLGINNIKLSWFKIFLFSSIIVGILWNITFMPTVMTPDSDVQWDQLISGRYDDWHPYFHTLFFLGPIKFLFNDTYYVGLVQQIWCYTLFSWLFSYFIRKGVSLYIALPLFGLYIFSYSIGTYNMIVWKDIPFSYAIITISVWLSYMILEEKKWKSLDYLIFFILLSASSYLRHNGLPYLLLIPVLLIFYKSQLYNKLFIGLMASLCYILFSIATPKLLEVKPKPSWYKSVNVYHISAGLYLNKPYTKTTKKTDQLLLSVLPKSVIQKKFNPTIWHKLHIENPEFNNKVFTSKAFWKELNHEFYSKNLVKNLPYIIGLKVNQFSCVSLGYGFTFYPSLAKEKYSNIRNTWFGSIFKKSHKKFFHNISAYNNKINTTASLKLIFWNSLIPIVILVMCWIYCVIKQNFIGFLVNSIIGIQLPIILVFGVSNDWRYTFVLYLSLFLSIPFSMIKTKSPEIKLG